jgi:hypothetical protein
VRAANGVVVLQSFGSRKETPVPKLFGLVLLSVMLGALAVACDDGDGASATPTAASTSASPPAANTSRTPHRPTIAPCPTILAR